jgi:hypothetical protein
MTLYKVNSQVYSHFEDDIRSGMTDILVEMNKISAEFTKLYLVNLKDYINVIKPVPLDIDNDLIISNINYTGVDARTGLDIVDIFNNFKLSEEIPFIGIGGQFINKTNPVVRAFKVDGTKVISDKEIRDFYVTENKKQNTIVYKKIKGLVFKIKIPETTSYANVLIEPNGAVSVNMKPNKKMAVIQNILDFIIKNLGLNVPLPTLSVGGKVPPRSPEQGRVPFTLTNLSVNIETPVFIDLTKIVDILKRPSINTILFELKEIISKDVLSVLYKKIITVNLKDNPYIVNSSIISILGATSVQQVAAIYAQIMIIYDLVAEPTTPSTMVATARERSNIKRLKELGVKVKSTNCQKQRQPIIVDSFTQDQLANPDSYPLEYMGKTYICQSTEHPFPGFTNENILCCFKKDQRKKEAFIRNTAADTETIVSSIKTKKHIITTEKILENNRFGVLINGLKESIEDILKIKNIYRYGVIQDKFSLANAIAKISPVFEDNSAKFLEQFNTFLMENKEDLEIYGYSSTQGVQNLLEKDIPKFLLFVSFFIKINFFVFEEERLECSTQIITDLSYPFVVLLKRPPESGWELIVEKSSDDSGPTTLSGVPQIKFDRSHKLIEFLEKYYHYSCEKKNYYPESFQQKYKPLGLAETIVNDSFYCQVVNLETNKVNFIQTKSPEFALIPVKEDSVKFGLKWKWINEVVLPTIDNQVAALVRFNQTALGVVLKGNDVIGVLSNTGVLCPVQPSSTYTGPLKPVDAPLGPYPFVDNNNNKGETWNRNGGDELARMHQLRLEFSKYLALVDPDLKDQILKIITDPKTTGSDKFKTLQKLIPPVIRDKADDPLDIDILIQEILVENTNNDIITNRVPSLFLDLTSTPSEDVFYTI